MRSSCCSAAATALLGLLGGAHAQHNQPGGRPPASVDLGQCTIMSVFTDLQAITTSPACQAGCAGGTGNCPPNWYPGSADECSADCGIIFGDSAAVAGSFC